MIIFSRYQLYSNLVTSTLLVTWLPGLVTSNLEAVFGTIPGNRKHVAASKRGTILQAFTVSTACKYK